MVQPVTTKPTTRQRENADGVYFVIHPSFSKSNAQRNYGPEADLPEWSGSYMPDEVTRECSKRMHYAAWRISRCKETSAREFWRNHYLNMRDQVVMGNRKLVFRAIRRWMPPSHQADDMTSDCQIVLIQSVAAYNPWMGIRFSTYAYTCLMRALSRMSQKMQADKINRSVPLETLVGTAADPFSMDVGSGSSLHLDEYLADSCTLLSPREKLVLIQRFCLDEKTAGGTLEQVGKKLGLSKERVRQVQARALDKLRTVLS